MTKPINRRNFVAGSSATVLGVGLGASLVGAQPLSAASREANRNGVIRVATVGARTRGRTAGSELRFVAWAGGEASFQ
jgi:hypothetical protein